MRQQIDESNMDLVNNLTQQLETIFSPLLQTTNTNYQLLANQMGWIVDVFGASQQNDLIVGQVANAAPKQPTNPTVTIPNQNQQNVPVMIGRNQNPDAIIDRIR